MSVQIFVPADRSEKMVITGLPFADGSKAEKIAMLREMAGSRIVVTYERGTGQWSVARSHFPTLARGLADRYGDVAMTVDRNEQDKCTPGCQEADIASADKCECVCLGLEHGGGYVGRRWKQVGDHLLVSGSSVVRTRYTLSAKAADKWRRHLDEDD